MLLLVESIQVSVPSSVPPTPQNWHRVPDHLREMSEILDWAFEAGLGRSDGWRVLNSAQTQEVAKAAAIYKRGVSWACEDHVCSPSARHAFDYSIQFLDVSAFMERVATLTSSLVCIEQGVLDHWPTLAQWPEGIAERIEEPQKDWETLLVVRRRLSQSNCNSATIIGGGAFCDLVAFACALEGISFTLVPTTLLSMVDACVGGKVACNYAPYGKNQLGLYAFPQEVWVVPELLCTLSREQWQSGWAEALKHGLLSQNMNLHLSLKEVSESIQKQKTPLSKHLRADLLAQLIRVKADVVAADPYEHSLRSILNFGHSIGHALEALSLNSAHKQATSQGLLSHGHAVAYGMIVDLTMSHRQGILPKDRFAQMSNLILQASLELSQQHLLQRTGCKDAASLWQSLYPYLIHDKKNQRRQLMGLYIEDWGRFRQDDRGSYLHAIKLESVRESFVEMFRHLPIS